ncbi:hypothetical protein C8Q75DRAFT_803684 [Abortiporus biennis]|nr:hypothetical protein C8Q75DRAFT_803684 [Abortiporus biennis]
MFAQSIVAALVALPFLAQSVLAADCQRTYVAKQGDTCDSISAANNASTYQLRVNNINTINQACTNIEIGQTVCLGNNDDKDCKSTYVVVGGDSCDAVASRHGLNSTMFNLNNPQLNSDCDNLYIGEVVCVLGTPTVPELPSGSPVPAATVPAGATPAVSITSAAASTSSAVSSTISSAAPTITVAADEGDDEDLPFCDEL